MMKLIIAIGMLSIVNSVYALGVSCGDEMRTYKLTDKARFDVCPAQNGNLSIYANSIGGNYHTCNFESLASKKGNRYIAKDGECEISFSIEGNKLTPVFSKGCKSFCGARADWRNGSYTK